MRRSHGRRRAGPPDPLRLGRRLAALRALIDAFYDRVEADELLSPFFPGGVSEHHRAHVAAWWAEVLGGPTVYTDELGGYESMLAHHRDLDITAEQRHRFASTMSLAADDAHLPDDPEFRAATGRVRRVGHPPRDAQLAARADDVAEHAPVPRWGWGVAPPYVPRPTSRRERRLAAPD